MIPSETNVINDTRQWEAECHGSLAAELIEVREALERCVSSEATRAGGNHQSRLIVSPSSFEKDDEDAHRSLALDRLCRTFGLSSFERSLLLLCAGLEIDAELSALCGAAHGDARMSYATFSLGMAALPDPHWSALTPASALRRWRLIEVGAGERLTASPLRVDERILHYLLGTSYLDERLQWLIEPVREPSDVPASQHSAVRRIAETWGNEEIGASAVIQLCGNDASGKRAAAFVACAALGLELRALRSSDLPLASSDRDVLARLWEREALLSNCALLIDDDNTFGLEYARGLLQFMEGTQALMLITSREPLISRERRVVRIDVNRPGANEQKAIWQRTLGQYAERLNGHIDLLSTQFDLSLHSISAASDEALRQCGESDDGIDLGPVLWDTCRRQARPKLDDLAHRIEPAATWDDLVLPPAQLQVLRSIAAHVRRRALVYDDWGFAARGARGLGISALFSGAAGTGKTMAAEVLASELRLDLYRIDLSAMVSKYIGETEKNLRRVFDAAETGGAILLFDEADALFGKRSEVKDSHDRYANIEVSYLLQRVEAYRGLAILTSNMKNALDSAFMRRIRFIVHFPFPDTAQRIEIWRRIFPGGTPTEGLSLEKLARLNLSGGNIRNLALNAAFLAADSGEPVQMKHLLIAAQAEYAKLEKPLGEAEIGGWA